MFLFCPSFIAVKKHIIHKPHRAPGAAGDINTYYAQVIHYTPHTRILGVESAPRVMYNRNRNTTPKTAQEEKTNV